MQWVYKKSGGSIKDILRNFIYDNNTPLQLKFVTRKQCISPQIEK
jgi:hypothetical protein